MPPRSAACCCVKWSAASGSSGEFYKHATINQTSGRSNYSLCGSLTLWQGDFARRQPSLLGRRSSAGPGDQQRKAQRRRNWCVCGPAADRRGCKLASGVELKDEGLDGVQTRDQSAVRGVRGERGCEREGGKGGAAGFWSSPRRMFLHFNRRLLSRHGCIMDHVACCVEIIDINVTNGGRCIRRPRGWRHLMFQSLCSRSARCILFIDFFFFFLSTFDSCSTSRHGCPPVWVQREVTCGGRRTAGSGDGMTVDSACLFCAAGAWSSRLISCYVAFTAGCFVPRGVVPVLHIWTPRGC